jgi:transposase InsO family protein
MGFLHSHIVSVCQAVKQRLRQWTRPDNHTLILNTALDLTRSKPELVLENALLRQQLIILQRQTKRPKLTWRDRSLIVLLASELRGWKEALIIVKPDTVLRWHRELFRRFWKRKSKSQAKQGRPLLTEDLVALIKRTATVRAARENATWGAERIRGELLKLGVRVSKSTIQRYIEERGSRSSNQTWATFLRNHASQIWACDFLQTYDIFFRTTFVFVIIELGSRRIVHFGVTRNPTDQWTAQQLREATPFGEGPRFLIRDRDSKYGESFAYVASDIEVLKTPYRAPRANAHCERFIGSLRRECLDHFIILNERHLHQIVKEYETYFNTARPHQGIDQRIPRQTERPEPLESAPDNGKLSSQPVLNGLHHIYSWVGAQGAGHSQAQRPIVH